MEIIVNNDKSPVSKEDAKQMSEAIKAFENGEKQPSGRFVILERLK